MTVHGADPARSVISVSATVAIGILVALVSVLALILAGPVPVGFVLGGLVLLIPIFVVRYAKAYGLFVLVLSILPVYLASRLSSDPGAVAGTRG